MGGVGDKKALRAEPIGRQGETAEAVAALGGESGGVLVVGDAGVGKTTLARAAIARVRAGDPPDVLWLAAQGSEPAIPFGVFAPFVDGAQGARSRETDPFFLLQTLRRELLERAGGKPLIIGVDDAHLLDGHSATLLYQLVASREARVIATMRPGPGPAPLRALWKEQLVERIDLEPLGRRDTLACARMLLGGGQLGGELAEALWRTSRGNPLYLRELLAAGQRSGRVSECGGMWRLTGELTVGPRLTELLRERLDTADAEELASLEVFAFAGPIPLSVAERVVPPSHVGGLQRLGLLAVERSHGEPTGRVEHPVVAESLRQEMSASRRRELSRLLADAFHADGRLQEELLRVVSWRLDSAVAVPPDVLLQAALQAGEHQHWPLSARLAEAAVAAGGGTEAALALADAHRAMGHFREALEALDGIECQGDDQVARGAVLRAYVLSLGLGRFEEADWALERAARRIGDAPTRTWVEAVQAGLLNFAGRPAEAVARSRPLLQRPDLPPRAELTARAASALGRAWCGHPDEALRLLADAPRLERPVQGGWLPASWMTVTRVLAFGQAGQVTALEDLAASDYRQGVQLDNRHLQGRAAGELGWAAILRGDLILAVRRFREATTVLAMVDSPGDHAYAGIGLAEALAETGDVAGATEALEGARPLAGKSPALGPRWEVAAARVEAAEGAIGDALGRLEEAAATARRNGLAGYEVMALHAAVRLGSTAVAERLTELEEVVGNELVVTLAAQARALAAQEGSADMLDRIAEVYARRELRLFAAEAAAQACQAHRRSGNPRRATASASRAHVLLGAPPDIRPLALVMAAVPPELTRREGEVATLAARGLSSSSIADRLCVSVRTVETHLARVYFKLGIGSRSELASALLVHGDGLPQVEAG